MSYIVLARKWRPQNFDDLTGQETISKTFKNAISKDKIVHAYLFSGPRGVGKTSTARILAKALNCTDRSGGEPCGSCDHCKAITTGASVDVFEIDGASNTGVDDVRELREAVQYAPSSGKYKVYIIDEVHMLSTAAFNALLKTLEEPPPHVIFIFATTEAKKIPSTILSRCQHHLFRKIPREQIKTHLKTISDKEGISIQDTPLEMISRAADGSMRDALTLLDQASSFSDDISEKDLQVLLGLPETDIITSLSSSIIDGDITSTLTMIKELTDRGYDLRTITKELLEHFRNLAILKVTENASGLLEFTDEEESKLRQQAEKIAIEPLTLILTELLRLDGEVKSAMNPRYTLELGLLRMSFVKGMTSVDEVLKMLNNAPGQTAAEEKPPKKRPEPPAEKKRVDPETAVPRAVPDPIVNKPEPAVSKGIPDPVVNKPEPLKDTASLPDKDTLWKKVVEHFDAEDHLLACKLAEARAVDLTGEELVIGFNGGMSLLSDSIKKNASNIEAILKELTGKRLKIKVVPLPAKKVINNSNVIKEKVLASPLVQEAMRTLNSSIVKVTSLKEDNFD